MPSPPSTAEFEAAIETCNQEVPCENGINRTVETLYRCPTDCPTTPTGEPYEECSACVIDTRVSPKRGIQKTICSQCNATAGYFFDGPAPISSDCVSCDDLQSLVYYTVASGIFIELPTYLQEAVALCNANVPCDNGIDRTEDSFYACAIECDNVDDGGMTGCDSCEPFYASRTVFNDGIVGSTSEFICTQCSTMAGYILASNGPGALECVPCSNIAGFIYYTFDPSDMLPLTVVLVIDTCNAEVPCGGGGGNRCRCAC